MKKWETLTLLLFFGTLVFLMGALYTQCGTASFFVKLGIALVCAIACAVVFKKWRKAKSEK